MLCVYVRSKREEKYCRAGLGWGASSMFYARAHFLAPGVKENAVTRREERGAAKPRINGGKKEWNTG